MTSRSLTSAERSLAASVFGDAIDYDAVRINNRKYWWFQPRSVTMAPNGHLWFHPKGAGFCDDFCETPVMRQAHFIHEMVHVWQHQKGIFLPFKRLPFARYNYSIKPGWMLERYGIEQQAEIVRHAFLLRNGYKIAGAPALEIYESILPFS